MNRKLEAFEGLERVIERLRAPDGCPWDREQTIGSIAKNFLEEACEIADAIDEADESTRPTDAVICEELGDLLMNILLAARIAEETGGFDVADVACGIAEKLVRRHPHVFGDAEASDSAAVLQRWEEIKAAEKQATRPGDDATPSVLDGVPRSLPPLDAAFELGRKAARIGFDWPDAARAFEKVQEEVRELEACQGGSSPSRAALEHEIGDLLLAVINFSRKVDVAPDRALRAANRRFVARFRRVEARHRAALEAGGPAPSLEEMEETWQQAKRLE